MAKLIGFRSAVDDGSASHSVRRRSQDGLLGLSCCFSKTGLQAAERGKFLDCQALAQFRMSASRSLLELNASRLYISSLTAVSGNVA